MITTAIINNSKVRTESIKGAISLRSIDEITFALIEKEKVKYLIVLNQKLTKNLLIILRQCKAVFPYLITVLICRKFRMRAEQIGVDYAVRLSKEQNIKRKIMDLITDFTDNRNQDQGIVRHDKLELNCDERSVRRGKMIFYLKQKEFELLQFFVENDGKTLGRDSILEAVWGIDGINFSNSVDVYFNRLRNKIDRGFDEKLLHTVHGKGYKMIYLPPIHSIALSKTISRSEEES